MPRIQICELSFVLLLLSDCHRCDVVRNILNSTLSTFRQCHNHPDVTALSNLMSSIVCEHHSVGFSNPIINGEVPRFPCASSQGFKFSCMIFFVQVVGYLFRPEWKTFEYWYGRVCAWFDALGQFLVLKYGKKSWHIMGYVFFFIDLISDCLCGQACSHCLPRYCLGIASQA